MGTDLQEVSAAHQLVYGAHTQLRHMLPQLLGDEAHKVHHIFGPARKALAQLGILGGHTHRAGVQVADPHHDASHGDQRRSGKAELLRAQHTGDGHIPAGHQLAVRLHHHTGAEPVLHQRLMGLGKA